MNGLGRLVLYTDKLEEGETCRWSLVDVKDLAWVPPGIEANLRLPKSVRKTRIAMKMSCDDDPFKSLVFARVEAGELFPMFPRPFPGKRYPHAVLFHYLTFPYWYDKTWVST